jgi:hypothetical protein
MRACQITWTRILRPNYLVDVVNATGRDIRHRQGLGDILGQRPEVVDAQRRSDVAQECTTSPPVHRQGAGLAVQHMSNERGIRKPYVLRRRGGRLTLDERVMHATRLERRHAAREALAVCQRLAGGDGRSRRALIDVVEAKVRELLHSRSGGQDRHGRGVHEKRHEDGRKFHGGDQMEVEGNE